MASILAVGTGTLIFLKLTNDFFDRDDWILIDEPLLRSVVAMRTPWLNRLMLLVTLTGNWPMVALGTMLMSVVLIRSGSFRYLRALLVTNIGALIFIDLAKQIIGRPRPPIEMAITPLSSFSFPSGHSYFAGVFYGLVAYFWIRHLKNHWWQLFFLGLGSAGVLMLGFSRIYLGVHWPTDVAAGLAISGTWLMMTVLYLEIERWFYPKEGSALNKREIYRLVVILTGIWVAALIGYYGFWVENKGINLGRKIISPMTSEAREATKTAPAARSRE